MLWRYIGTSSRKCGNIDWDCLHVMSQEPVTNLTTRIEWGRLFEQKKCVFVTYPCPSVCQGLKVAYYNCTKLWAHSFMFCGRFMACWILMGLNDIKDMGKWLTSYVKWEAQNLAVLAGSGMSPSCPVLTLSNNQAPMQWGVTLKLFLSVKLKEKGTPPLLV